MLCSICVYTLTLAVVCSIEATVPAVDCLPVHLPFSALVLMFQPALPVICTM